MNPGNEDITDESRHSVVSVEINLGYRWLSITNYFSALVSMDDQGLRRAPCDRAGGDPIATPTPGGNDESPPTVQSFMPTRNELVVLACHYMEKANATEFNCWVDGVKGTTDWRFIVFAERRLGSIRHTLGDDTFNAATDPIAEKWRAKYARAEESGVICEQCGTLQDKQPNDRCLSCQVDGTARQSVGSRRYDG